MQSESHPSARDLVREIYHILLKYLFPLHEQLKPHVVLERTGTGHSRSNHDHVGNHLPSMPHPKHLPNAINIGELQLALGAAFTRATILPAGSGTAHRVRAIKASSLDSRLALVVAVVARPCPLLVVDGVAWNKFGTCNHAVLESSLGVSVEVLGAMTLGAVHMEDI